MSEEDHSRCPGVLRGQTILTDRIRCLEAKLAERKAQAMGGNGNPWQNHVVDLLAEVRIEQAVQSTTLEHFKSALVEQKRLHNEEVKERKKYQKDEAKHIHERFGRLWKRVGWLTGGFLMLAAAIVCSTPELMGFLLRLLRMIP